MDKTLRRWAPLFVLPALICFFIAFLVPMIMGLVLSFFKFSTVTDGVFVGWSNYKRIFTDMDFIRSLWMKIGRAHV